MSKQADNLDSLADNRDGMYWVQTLIPVAICAVVVMYLLIGVSRATSDTELKRFDFDTFAKLPVSKDGRTKPIDSVARNMLLQISGKQSLIDEMLLPEENGVEQPAVIWMAELMAGRPEARQRKVIRIDDPDILGMMGKTPEDGKFYSLDDLAQPMHAGERPVYMEMERLAREAQDVRDDLRTQFQEHVIAVIRKASAMVQVQGMATPFVIPPVQEGQDWEPIVANTRGELSDARFEREPAQAWLDMMQALRDDEPAAFNAQVKAYHEQVAGYTPAATRKAAFERGYNAYAPFVKGIALYVLAGLLGLGALLLRPVLPASWYTVLWRTGLGILAVTFVLHTGALLVRIWLQGRPPVTNLYSSAVFIGWALVGGAILLEKITKLGVASLAAASGGVATLIVAHHLAQDGDTMGVMQAVLDSNFWLGTHVITITLGYSATFLAGFIAIIYVLFGMATPLMDRKAARSMAGMVYAVTCFALFFSFVGTVLGGIWADQSWGRFWGWDPKENGAILIVLMNAILLHARWGHLVKERGIMVIAIGANIVVSWSWFGTNLLGVGLHSYGFMDGAMFVLAVFAASQLLLMGAALILPTNLWMFMYRPRHTPAIPPGMQVGIGAGLFLFASMVFVSFIVLTFRGELALFYWFLGTPLAFVLVGGVGQLVDGLKRLLSEAPMKPGLAPA